MGGAEWVESTSPQPAWPTGRCQKQGTLLAPLLKLGRPRFLPACSPKLGADCLQVTPVSQAQARQRSGRAGAHLCMAVGAGWDAVPLAMDGRGSTGSPAFER